MREPPYADRFDAGARLGDALADRVGRAVVAVGLMRGGLPVAARAAHGIGAPFAPFFVRKACHPRNPELAIGAIAEGGVSVVDGEAAAELGEGVVERALNQARAELDAALGQPGPRGGGRDLTGRTACVIDDGLATGLSAIAAARGAQAVGATAVIVASPVASAQAAALLAELGLPLVAPIVAPRLLAVGRWYADFQPPHEQLLGALLGYRAEVRRELVVIAGARAVLELPAGYWRRGVIVVVGSEAALKRRLAQAQLWGFGALALPLTGERAAAATLEAVAWLRRQPQTSLLPHGLWAAEGAGGAVLQAARWLGRGVAAVAVRMEGDGPQLLPAAPTLLCGCAAAVPAPHRSLALPRPAEELSWFARLLCGTESRPLW